MASTIRGSDNFDSAGGNAVKAWVNFNGTGTVAIRASYNVSSITDNGTGDYTVNFTTAMADANYAVLGTCNTHAPTGAFDGVQTVTYSTSSIRITTTAYEGSESDVTQVNVSVFR
jgi:hypothetical protein